MFLYFDLGNVLLPFDHARACRQVGSLLGLPAEDIRRIVFDSGLQHAYETGAITTAQFCDEVGRHAAAPPDRDRLGFAASSIFDVNIGTKALVGRLQVAGHRLGLLSNTCEMHWEFVSHGRFRPIPEAFSALALSYRIGAAKPDARIFLAAAELAQVEPRQIFYTDDRPENVAAARAVGFDAVVFSSWRDLVDELRRRDVRFDF